MHFLQDDIESETMLWFRGQKRKERTRCAAIGFVVLPYMRRARVRALVRTELRK